MINRICNECKKNIAIDKDNIPDDILFYKNQYYHIDCFKKMCEIKISSPRARTAIWKQALSDIPLFAAEFKSKINALIDKDNIFVWISKEYNISKVNDRVFEKLDQVYKGKAKGQIYEISPKELLKEWKYYIDDLKAIHYRRNIKGGINAILYDLSILVDWNARYREDMRKREIAEQERVREEATKEYIDYSKVQGLKGTHTQDNNVNLSNILDDFI
jgi:hypothetical protein